MFSGQKKIAVADKKAALIKRCDELLKTKPSSTIEINFWKQLLSQATKIDRLDEIEKKILTLETKLNQPDPTHQIPLKLPEKIEKKIFIPEEKPTATNIDPKAGLENNNIPAADQEGPSLKELDEIKAFDDTKHNLVNAVVSPHPDIHLDQKSEVLLQKQTLYKNKFKLDINNPDHLALWSSEVAGGLFGKGGIKVGDHRIPTRIHNMMKILTQEYADEVSLIQAFEQARKHQPGYFNNPFSYVTRQALTESFYTEENIEYYPEIHLLKC